MYNCRKLTRKEIESVYSLYMKKDFPKDELKPLSMINRSLDKGQYFCYGIFDDDKLCGYACFVSIDIDSKQCCLLDYFAVLSDMRDKGIGSAFLRLLKDELDPAEIVLCESESPEGTENDELVTRKRRIAFVCPADKSKNHCVIVLKDRIDWCVIGRKHGNFVLLHSFCF